MKKKFVNIALAAFVLLSALCLARPEGKNHENGLTAAELTLETTQSGNQERRTYVNSEGAAVVPLGRDYATLLRTKDDDGNVILEQYLDARDQPVVRSGNYAAVGYSREAGEIRITYLDAQLKPTTITSGYSSIRRTLTPEGRALQDTYLDLQGKPAKTSGGYYGLLRSYDDQGRVREIVYLDANGNPTRISGGYCREVRILDDAGRIAAVYYRDGEGSPVRASQGQYGEGYQRDENGRVTLITYLDAAGNPAPVNAGYTMLSRSYYRDGYPFEDRYFDAAGNPFALSKGQYGIRRVGDVTLQLDRNGGLMPSIDNLLNGLPVMVALVGCLLCIALCCLPPKPRGILLAAYVVFIFYETLMFRETGDPRTALIPFSYVGSFWKSYGVRLEIVNNIWLFVPLGAGLYGLFPKRRVLWIPFLLTLGIEMTQYVTGLGLMQADDILGNTFGAVVGYLLADRLRFLGRRLKKAKRGDSLRKTEYALPAPVNRTIALVTDLHEFDPEPVLEILRQARPDVIAVAGDTLERHHRGENLDKGDKSLSSRLVCAGIRAAEKLGDLLHLEPQAVQAENAYRFFREAGRLAPVALSRGNHELYLTPEDRAVMSEAGVTLLDNESAEIGGILLGGLTSRQVTGALDRGFLERFSAFPGYKVLLCHHPEYYPELCRYPIDLILSGHCHGGQIRVFGRGLFAPGQGILPKYHHGVYDGRLVVSAGCANTAPIPRWGNEPEVVIVRLGS